MSADGAAENRTEVRRTLLLLPAMVGLAGVGLTIAAAMVSGVTDGSRGWLFTAIAAALVLITVLSGGSYGLYAALAVVAIGALVADGGPVLAELIGLVLSLIVVHEVVRFSLDARRPSRFGPGLVGGYVGRTVVVAALASGAAAIGWALIDRAPTAGLWIPFGVAVAALPLFARDGAELMERTRLLDRPLLRGAVGAVSVTAILLVVVVGSQSRTEISSNEGSTATTVTTTTAVAPDRPEQDEGEGQELSPWFALVAVVVIAVVVYLILRRPEAVFELDDMEKRVEDHAFDTAIAGLAEADDEMVEVDDQTLARLLRDLQLDISAERDPGRAIRFGYAKIEQQLAEISLLRTEVETEREFLVRAAPTLGRAGGSMTELTNLFERARFGHEPVDEPMRQRAMTAIDELLDVVSTEAGQSERRYDSEPRYDDGAGDRR